MRKYNKKICVLFIICFVFSSIAYAYADSSYDISRVKVSVTIERIHVTTNVEEGELEFRGADLYVDLWVGDYHYHWEADPNQDTIEPHWKTEQVYIKTWWVPIIIRVQDCDFFCSELDKIKACYRDYRGEGYYEAYILFSAVTGEWRIYDKEMGEIWSREEMWARSVGEDCEVEFNIERFIDDNIVQPDFAVPEFPYGVVSGLIIMLTALVFFQKKNIILSK